MTAEREIDYEALAQSAMRGIVRTVLTRVARSGLPGEHHFYIAFKTGAPGVVLSKRLKEKYPEEMTVVLQHRFWDLLVNDVRFEVKLTFDSIPERLVVPFDAIKVFFDPSVPYGLQFEEGEGEGAGAQPLSVAHSEAPRADAGGGEPVKVPTVSEGSRAEKKPRASRRPQSEKGAEPAAATGKASAKLPATKSTEPGPASGPKVVSIDAFRKK
jgi:hypothetical protein